MKKNVQRKSAGCWKKTFAPFSIFEFIMTMFLKKDCPGRLVLNLSLQLNKFLNRVSGHNLVKNRKKSVVLKNRNLVIGCSVIWLLGVLLWKQQLNFSILVVLVSGNARENVPVERHCQKYLGCSPTSIWKSSNQNLQKNLKERPRAPASETVSFFFCAVRFFDDLKRLNAKSDHRQPRQRNPSSTFAWKFGKIQKKSINT